MCEGIAKKMAERLEENPMSCAIVDDDEKYREHLSFILQSLGFDVWLYGDGENFEIGHCDKGFDVVIVSWEVEPFLGEHVFESIRKCNKPHPKVIIGCDGGQTLSFHLDLPPFGFLFKPFNAKRFMEVMQKVMEE
jgi:FixJ family two-component response regulator